MSGEEKKEKIKILHVANISMACTKDNVFTMFNYLGKVEELKIYPSEANITSATKSKVAFIKYEDERSVEAAQHLTNTVVIDQALICVPYLQQVIPDEESFFNSGGSATAGQRQLPPHVSNKIQDVGDGSTMLLTVDPTLEQLGLPSYPQLPGDTDLSKVEEIRRTIYVGNLPKGVEGKAVLDFFNAYVGEVMYVRMACGMSPDALPCAYAYVEFSQQTSIPNALQNNGMDFEGRSLRIQHSRVAIIKPQQKTADQALEEVEEAIRLGKTGSEKRSRSRSPRRRRTPSPRRKSRSPRRRSRSRERRRSRDRKKSRSRSKDKTTRRSRSRDKDKRRSRSRDRDAKRRSRSRDRRRRSRSKDKDKKRTERERTRSPRDKKKDKEKDDKKERKRSRSRDKKREKDDIKDTKKDSKKEGGSSSEDEWEEARPKLKHSNGVDKEKSRIRNERKRRLSTSDGE